MCTDNYKLIEVKLLIKALINKFNLKCTIHYKKNKINEMYFRIYISRNYLKDIKSLIIPHMHKSYIYKIDF